MGNIHGIRKQEITLRKIGLEIWTIRNEIKSIIRDCVINKSKDEIKKAVEKLNKIYQDPLNILHQSAEKEKQGEATSASEDSDKGEDLGLDQLIQKIKNPPLLKENIAKGSTFLSDITMEEINFFSSHNYVSGQSIIINFLIPRNFSLTADISQCFNYNFHGQIQGGHSLPYRVKVIPRFNRPGERSMLRTFINSYQVDPSADNLDPSIGLEKSSLIEDGAEENGDIEIEDASA